MKKKIKQNKTPFPWESTDKHWIPIMSYRNSLNQAGTFDKHDRRKSRYDSGKTIEDIDDLSVPPSPFRHEETENHVDTLHGSRIGLANHNSTAVR